MLLDIVLGFDCPTVIVNGMDPQMRIDSISPDFHFGGLTAALLAVMSNTTMVHVPYKGVSEVYPAVVSGQVNWVAGARHSENNVMLVPGDGVWATIDTLGSYDLRFADLYAALSCCGTCRRCG